MRALFLVMAGITSLAAQQWTAIGEGGAVAAEGKSGLAFKYVLGAKKFSAAVLPASGALDHMQRIRFRVKADHDTAVAVLLSEHKPGGGDYSAWFWASANQWQQIELSPGDFAVNDGPNDPVDPDGKLDLDQVEGVGILDLAHFFNELPVSSAFPVVVARSEGMHTLWLEDFQILSSAPVRRKASVKTISIDAFDRGFLQWITLGGMNLKLVSADNPVGGPALQASYEQVDGRFAVLVGRLSTLDLSKAKRIAFDIASDHEAMLVVSLEMKKPGSDQGPRFNVTIYPPAGRKMFHVSLSLEDFEQNPAGTLKLDPSRLKSITITDVTAVSGGEAGANTIWIGNVEALEAK
ncbi:MAG: hypothetical protein M3O35_11390 [Acidobacteriota bacterium]|nr:hypothetical protein [Acidobacteriota bacterium]